MSDSLKPCPCCGGKGRIRSDYDADMTRWHHVECDDCPMRTKGKWHSDGNDCPLYYQEIRDEWNNRPLVDKAYMEGAEAFKNMVVDSLKVIFKPHIEGVFAVFTKQREEGRDER